MYENEEESFILWSSWYAWLHKSYLIHDDDREAITYDWFNTHIKNHLYDIEIKWYYLKFQCAMTL